MPKSIDPVTTTTNDSFRICDICNQQFHRRGFVSHQAACLKKAEQQRKDAIFDARMQDLAAQKQVREGEFRHCDI